MFPIPWNRAFRKKDGTLVNMEDASGGGSGGLPPYSAADAGKVLGVTNDGKLAWVSESAGRHNAYRASSLSVLNIPSASAKEVND